MARYQPRNLTPREKEALKKLLTGKTHAKIATDMRISEPRLSILLANAAYKMGFRGDQYGAAAQKAQREGLL